MCYFFSPDLSNTMSRKRLLLNFLLGPLCGPYRAAEGYSQGHIASKTNGKALVCTQHLCVSVSRDYQDLHIEQIDV